MAKLPNLWFFGAFFRSKRQNMSYPELKSQVITTKWNKINDRRQRQTIHWLHLTSTPNKSEDAWVSLWYVPPPKQDGPPAAAANAGSERAGHCSGVVERVESQKA